jgi:hypothetical protein
VDVFVANIAKTRGRAEGRSVPFSSLAGDDETDTGVDPRWFQDADGQSPGGWRTHPSTWSEIPEDRLLGVETLGRIREAIASLPPMQAEVIRLRDVLGWSAEEVCGVLALSDANQRVLLHRARSRVPSRSGRVPVERIGGSVSGPNLTCRDVVELITDYLEDALPSDDRRRVEEHLGACPDCPNYVEQMRETIRLTGKLTEEQIPQEQKAKLLEAFRGWTR